MASDTHQQREVDEAAELRLSQELRSALMRSPGSALSPSRKPCVATAEQQETMDVLYVSVLERTTGVSDDEW